MSNRKGYLLQGLLLLFSVLALSSTVGVLEQNPRLKRFSENEVKADLDCLRRAVDLFRRVETPARVAALEVTLAGNDAMAVIDYLAAESYIRGRIATGPLKWRIIRNIVQNPSFEDDSGINFSPVAGWQGNFTANDGVPDGWQLTAAGAEQKIDLGPATYVASFWARAASPNAQAKLRIWQDAGPLHLDITANDASWKRYHGYFRLAAPETIRLELLQNNANPGDVAYLDGVMIEEWKPPAGTPPTVTPVPSAWAKGPAVVFDLASTSIQPTLLEDLLTSGSPATLTWLFEW